MQKCDYEVVILAMQGFHGEASRHQCRERPATYRQI